MKRIIVPTDFSPCSMSALRVAVELAKKIDAVISIVHTYAIPIYGFTSGQLMYDGVELGKIKGEIDEELDRIAQMDFIQGQTVEKYLLPEYSVDQIVEHETLKTADLIVMGTNGASGFKEVLGSNAERMIRKAPCPVLAVREGAEKNFNIRNVVFASTFYGEVYDRFPTIKKFVDLFDAKLHLLHVNTPSDFMTTDYSDNLMNSFVEKFGLINATVNIYNDSSVEDGVINFARRMEADLIALETHGRTGLNHVFGGSIAEDVANHVHIPVLTYRIKEAPKPRGVIFPEMR